MCCGQKRAQARKTSKTNQVSIPKPEEKAAPDAPQDGNSVPYFQYVGKNSGLIVIGKQTRKRYHFNRPGVVLAVDPMDKSSLTAIPYVRQVGMNKSKS